MKHITDLTCCRALFAGWVFAYHLNLQAHYASFLGPVGTVIQRGNLGVDGFFILSGMVLAHAHPDLAPTLNEARWFWARRLVRIYPVHIAMIVALCGMIGVAAILHLHPRDPDRFSLPELFSHLALVHAWGASDRWAWNYPSWSISAEWAGYLLFPFLWALLRRQNGTGLAVVLPLTFVGVAVCQAVARAEHLSLTFDGGLLRFFPEFIAGMAIVPLLPKLRGNGSGHLAAAIGALIVMIGAVCGFDVATITGLWCVLAGLLLAARQRRGSVFGRVPAMAWLGEISYSYYMSFALVETLQATVWRRVAADPAQHPLIYVVTTTALTLGVATLSWRFVELPSLRAFAGYARRRAVRVASAGATMAPADASRAARP
jgi:peptidoglycan/LPS O-acetylase OafA/YrhL